MDEKTQKILDLLKFHDSSALASLQTKFTKTANSIDRDVIQGRLNVLYSEQEIATLLNAVGILKQTKDKIAHAKEIQSREERRLNILDDLYEKQQLAIIDQHVALDSMSPEDILVMNCFFLKGRLLDYLDRDINELFKSPKRLAVLCAEWKIKIQNELKECFPFRKEPTADTIIAFMHDYQLKYRQQTLDRCKTTIEKFTTFLAAKGADNVELLGDKK